MKQRSAVKYDADADVLYVYLNGEGRVSVTRPLGDLRLVDYGQDGSVVGIEFIGASGGVDLTGVPFAAAVAAAIGDSGLAIQVFA